MMKKPAETLTVTLLQADLAWENPAANLDLFEGMINAVKGKMEVVVLPEMFTTGFSMDPVKLAEEMDGPSLKWMKRMAASYKIIITGSLIIRVGNDYYNRLIWMQPNGECYYYDKRHLFAYAGEGECFTAGSKRVIVSAKGWKFNLQVCYDLRFPVWARQQRKIAMAGPLAEDRETGPEYDVLIYVANWPERRNHAWKTLLQARAIENQCFVVGVNRIGKDGNEIDYSGDSVIIGPLGETLHSMESAPGSFTYTLALDTLKKTREKLPFLDDADAFLIGL